jgi:hypothetical protein
MKTILVTFFTSITCCCTFWSQRLSTGVSFGTIANQHIEFPNNYLFPSNSYFIYYTGNEKKDYKPIYNKPLSGWIAGLNINVDYKSLLLSTELNIATTSIDIPAIYPNDLGNLLGDSWSTFETNKLSFLLNVLANYKLTSKANGPFIQLGGQFSTNSFSEVRGTLDTDISDAVWLFISEYEMYGIIYTNKRTWFNGLFGIGYKVNDRYYTLRYSQRMFGNLEDYPLAKFYQLDFMVSQTLNFQKLKKGYKIYLD